MIEYPFPKASLQHRFGQLLLEFALLIVTLGIGYFIWFFIVLGRGQTPGKQILKLRVYDATTGMPAKWGHMFIRELGIYLALSLGLVVLAMYLGVQTLSEMESMSVFEGGQGNFEEIVSSLIFLIDALWIFKGNERKRLIDVICKTDVLNEAATQVLQKDIDLRFF